MQSRRIAVTLIGLSLLALAVVVAVTGDVPCRVLGSYCSEPEPARSVPTSVSPVTHNPFAAVLANLAAQPSFSIVQVGAYIGDTPNDPLFPFLRYFLDPAKKRFKRDAKVVLIEPIREYFDLLRENYGNLPGLEFENVAIAESEGTREMYRLDVDPTKYGFPAWLSQLSSLKNERMGELWERYERNPHLQKFYLEHRVTETVKSVTLQQLLDRHRIEHLDLLQIDAEGYDFEILQTLDFSKTKPTFINYERVLLQENEPACRRLLSDQGYMLIDWGQDTLAIRVR